MLAAAWRTWGSVAVAVGLLAACSSTVGPVTDTATLKRLAFLQAGATSRAEVAARLGSPVATYEGGLVVTYPWSADPRHAGAGRHRLVVVYAADGTLERWSLVDRGY